MGAVGGNCGDGVALVEGLLGGQTVVAQELGVDHRAFAQVQHAPAGLRQVGGGGDGVDPGHGLGLAGVDALDAGMGVGAAQDLAVQHAGEIDVGSVLRPPGDLVGAVVAKRAAANDAVALGGGGSLGGGHWFTSQWRDRVVRDGGILHIFKAG